MIKPQQQLLPTNPPVIAKDPTKLKYLLIGPPKWGKTTFFTGCPNSILLAFESGFSEAECPVIAVNSWDRSFKKRKAGWEQDEDGVVYTSAMEALEELEANNIYDMIIVDTLNAATKMAADYHCDLARVQHPSDGGEYGRGWDLLQTAPVRRFINRLTKLGSGVALTTHSKERTDKDKFGKDRFRRETSLPGGVQELMVAWSDLIMHGFMSRRRKGKRDRDRYISFDGTNEIIAGTRLRKTFIPANYIVDPPTMQASTAPWEQWANFFADNPTAGQEAEANFNKLYRGKDNENLPDDEEEEKKGK
jgi:hypothetical protein